MKGHNAQTLPLLQLVLNGDLKGLSTQKSDELKQFRDKNGSTLLHYAAGCGENKKALDICRHLLNTIDVDCRSENNGRTPLHWAARNGHTHVCELLIEHGAAVDSLAKGQVTPLQLAVWQCHLSTSKYLVKRGANPHFPNAWGCVIGHWLGKSPIYNGKDDTTNLLTDTCEWLFEDCRVEHNTPNNHGQTPLHKAAFAGNFVVAKYLIANLEVMDNLRDHNGNTAADCAERSQQYELAKWLRRHASVEVHNAVAILNLRTDKNSTFPPSFDKVRGAYLKLAKIHHPDISIATERWEEIRDAYQILRSFWEDDPEVFDCQIRIRSRNRNLLEYERLCWHPRWHDSQSSPLSPQQSSGESVLAEFESRLVRLLSTDLFSMSGLSMAQLPKEYEKNFHTKLPKPRDFDHRKLTHLIEKECGSIKLELREGKQALLRVA